MANVVTLCGSTRFKDEFYNVARNFTIKGWIVLMPHVFGHSGDTISPDKKEMLDDLHKRKIDMSEYIYVINPGGYIGESTKSEIEYALKHNKDVMYMDERGQINGNSSR